MKEIHRYTEEDTQLLLSKTPYVLPDNPSSKMFSAKQIRGKLYEGYLLLKDWINAVIDTENENIRNINNYFIEKLTTIDGIVVIPTNSSQYYNNYLENQMFFIKDVESLAYRNAQGSLTIFYDLNNVRDNVGFIKPSSTTLSSAEQVEVVKDHCFMIYSGRLFVKQPTSDQSGSYQLNCLEERSVANGLITEVEYRAYVNESTYVLSISSVTRTYYTKNGAEAKFVDVDTADQEIAETKRFKKNIRVDGTITDGTESVAVNKIVTKDTSQTISGEKTFSSLPKTEAGRSYDSQRQVADKELVDEVQDNLDTHEGKTNNPHSVTKDQVGLGSVTNDAQVKRTEMGVALGVATLDANGKLLYVQIPDILLGQMIYGGAVTGAGLATLSTNGKTKLGTSQNTIQLTNNTTALTGYTSNEGLFYIVSSTGSFANLDLQQGDWLIANASGWSKIDNTDAVRTVQGRTGDVVIVKSDIGLQYIESDVAPIYDNTATYEEGDVVVYEGKLYLCNEDIDTAEDFDDTKWTETNVKTLLNNLKNYTDNLLYRVPQYVDISFTTSDTWILNSQTNRYEITKTTGVLDLESDDRVVCLPNGYLSDGYIRTYGIKLESFNDTTGVATFSCMVVPEESVDVTLEILRR